MKTVKILNASYHGNRTSIIFFIEKEKYQIEVGTENWENEDEEAISAIVVSELAAKGLEVSNPDFIIE